MKNFRFLHVIINISNSLKWTIFMFNVTINLGIFDFRYFWIMTLPETKKGGEMSDYLFYFFSFLNLWTFLFLSAVSGTIIIIERDRIWMLIKYVNIRFGMDPLQCLVIFIMANIYYHWINHQSLELGTLNDEQIENVERWTKKWLCTLLVPVLHMIFNFFFRSVMFDKCIHDVPEARNQIGIDDWRLLWIVSIEKSWFVH